MDDYRRRCRRYTPSLSGHLHSNMDDYRLSAAPRGTAGGVQIYIPIWTIIDWLYSITVPATSSIYIPIWTIIDLALADQLSFAVDIYIPIWTIIDLPTSMVELPEGHLHSNMDDYRRHPK